MTTLYRISINSDYSLEQAWNKLEEAGIDILYGSEEEQCVELFAHLSSSGDLPNEQWIVSCEPYTLPTIDWEAQWATHGHNFQDGCVNIDLSSFGKSTQLRLQPGSGFGDLSHPTTRLMMNMLAQSIKHQTVIDIGCGSGILTLTAAAMGASHAYGIDIDPQAVEHSYQNARLNDLENQCQFYVPSDFNRQCQFEPVLILMNMIWTEQLNAWESLPSLHGQNGDILTSGIRNEERLLYLEQTKKWGWMLQREQEEMGWLAFHFLTKS